MDLRPPIIAITLVTAGALIAAASTARAAGAAPARAAEGTTCPSVTIPAAPAPHLRAALARHEPAIIVAIGSSSTRSWQSSDPAHSYPAVLQARLAVLLPHAHIAVINRGVNGEDASEEIARLQADVVAVRPQLVIWQVGANGALRRMEPAVFVKLVGAGIAVLSRSGADVLLMNNQRSPRIMAEPEHAAFDLSLARLAQDTEAELFDRGALMDAWAAAGAPYSQFTSPDRLHHNDFGYRCLGEAVATAIVEGLGPAEPGGNGPGSNGPPPTSAADAAPPPGSAESSEEAHERPGG